jgi:uncharacterized membrane protein
MSTNSRVQKIAVTGVLSALVIVLGLTGVGFVRIPPFSLTIMHVPIIIGAILEGPVVGLATGFLFGVFSLVQAAIQPSSPVEAAFLNPLISVAPRLFIGPAAWFVYHVIAGFGPGADRRGPARASAAIVAGALAGTLTNTVLVLGAIGLFKVLPPAALLLAALPNGPLEAALAAAITLPVVSAWKHIRRGGKSRLSREMKRDGGPST